jgi:hypothetical protein
MSARETHPIDDRFRQVLMHAEVAPPPSVWENIQQDRRSRRYLPPWFRLNSILLILVPLVGFTTYMLWPSEGSLSENVPEKIRTASIMTADQPAREETIRNSEIVPQSSSNGTSRTLEADAIGNDLTTNATGSRTAHTIKALAEGSQPSQKVVHSGGPGSSATPSDGSITASRNNLTTERDAKAGSLESEPSTVTRSTRSANDLAWTIPTLIQPVTIRPERTVAPSSVITSPPIEQYVLPSAEWLFSLSIARYDLQRNWYGNDTDLLEALDRSEANTSTYAIGLGVSRHWRSGWGVSLGAFHERSEQRFEFEEERIEVAQQVQTYIVTLDTDVFYSNSDTIQQVTSTRENFEGLNRRSVLRIPIDGHYHWQRGRLYYGPRLGAAVEFTTVEQDRSMTLDREEGRLTATSLSEKELRERHPVTLMGMVGLDLGYTINERWSLWAMPAYIFPATPLTRTGDAWTAPYRFGGSLRLSYHFTPKK